MKGESSSTQTEAAVREFLRRYRGWHLVGSDGICQQSGPFDLLTTCVSLSISNTNDVVLEVERSSYW